MPYSVITRDGIQINNIPDNISRDSDQLRQRVEQARQDASNQGLFGQQSQQPKVLKEGEGSDFARGFGTYFDQYGGILGGAKVLTGKATGNDELIMSGVADMQESEAKVGARGVKETDEFTKAWDKGISAVLTEFVPYIMGQGLGMVGEAFVTSIAGAMIGSAVAPGAGTGAGALTGFVGKELVKRGIIEAAKDMTQDEAKDYLRLEVGKVLESEVGKKAIKDIYKKAGSNVALSGMAAKFGAGEVTGRAVDEAIVGIDDPELQLQKIKELSTSKLAALSTAHALADYIGIKIGLGSLDKLAKPTQSLLLNIAKNVGVTGLKEAPVEAVQSALERAGADLPLSDKAAIEEYINAAAAGFAMPIIPATIGGIRTPRTKQESTPTTSSPEGPTEGTQSEPTGPEPTQPPQPEDRKGWKYTEDEVKYREKIQKDRETADLNKDKVEVDLDDADARMKQLTSPDITEPQAEKQGYNIPSYLNVEQTLQEKADDSKLRDAIETRDRGGIGVSELKPTKPGTRTTDTKKPSKSVRPTVVKPTDDVVQPDGREGESPSTLAAQQNVEGRIFESEGEGQRLSNLGPLQEGYERVQTGSQRVATKEYDMPSDFVGTPNYPNVQSVPLYTDRPKKVDFQVEQKELGLGTEPVSDLERYKRNLLQSVYGIPEYQINRQGEIVPAQLQLQFNQATENLNKKAYPRKKADIPYSIINAEIAEKETLYNEILKTNGKAAADTYIRNVLKTSPSFNEDLATKDSLISIQESATPIFATNNLESAKEYIRKNNFQNHYIQSEEDYEGKILAYSVRPKTTLPNTNVNTIADFIIKDKGKTLNKQSNPLVFGEWPKINSKYSTPQKVNARKTEIVNNVKNVLQQKLDTNQFNKLNSNPRNFEKIAIAFAKQSSDQDLTSNADAEIKERNLREKEFNQKAPSLPGFDSLIKRLNIDINKVPSFLKTGAVFGSANSPIQNAKDIDEVIEKVIGEFVYEEAADKNLKASDFKNSSKKDKDRRKKFRNEFINSVILQDYIDRLVRYKEKPRWSEVNDIVKEAERYEKYFIHGTQYNDGRDISAAIHEQDLKALKKLVQDQKDKAALKRAKDRLKKQVKDALEEGPETENTAELVALASSKIDEIEVEEGLDAILDALDQVPPALDPFNVIRESKNIDNLNDVIDAFDTRSDVTRIISSTNGQDAVTVLDNITKLLEAKLARAREQYTEVELNGKYYMATDFYTNMLEYVNILKNVPGMNQVAVLVTDAKRLGELSNQAQESLGLPVTKDNTDLAGFYTANVNARLEVVQRYSSQAKKIFEVPEIDGYTSAVFLTDAVNSEKSLENLLHELTHAATEGALGFNLDGIAYATRQELAYLDGLLEQARKVATERNLDFYGLTNIPEFISEAFNNRKFQEFLVSVESTGEVLPDNTVPSLFDKFVRFVSNLLGLDNIDNTLLADVIAGSSRFFTIGQTPRPFEKTRIEEFKGRENYSKKMNELYIIDSKLKNNEISERNANNLKTINEFKYPNWSIRFSKDRKRNVDIIKFPRATKQDRTSEQISSDYTETFKKEETTLGNKIKNAFSEFFRNGDKGLTAAIRNFSNRAIDIKKVQDYLQRSNLLLIGVEGFNNVFDQLTRAFGVADYYMKDMQPLLEQYSKDFGAYVELQKQKGLTESEAKAELQKIMTGLHEGERREVKFLLDVPLSAEKIIKLKSGEVVSPADLRDSIMNQITTKVWDTSTEEGIAKRNKDLENYKNQLRRLADSNTKISGQNTVDSVLGKSYLNPEKVGGVIDIESSRYDVSELSSTQASIEKSAYKNLRFTDPQLYNAIQAFINSMNALNKNTLNLNAKANYASPQAMNIINFYGWENYIPLKKAIDDNQDAFFNPTGGRLSRELKKLESSFEGNHSQAEEPFTQALVDASRAAARAGRIDYTQAIYNAVVQTVDYVDPTTGKPVKGKAIDGKVTRFTYEQRYRNDPDIQKELQKTNTVVHFLPDGSLAVIEIKDENLVKAIRGAYADNGMFISFMNKITGGIGQLHTRFNPPFATLNFVRDAITNIFYVSADMGFKDMGGYLQHIAGMVTNGGMLQVAKVMNDYQRGRLDNIRKYAKEEKAKGNSLPESLFEYLQNGGMISYSQSLSIENAYQRLQRTVKRATNQEGYITSSKQNIKDFFDVWMSTFEMATRAAAYQTAKQNYLTKNAAGKPINQVPENVYRAAVESSVVYAKRLSNFEERGLNGDAMGAWFMFFKPSAVGITRAFESLSALRSKEASQENLPNYIKGNPEALAAWSADFDRRRQGALGMMAAGVGLGFAVWQMAALTGGDDDENKTRNDDPARWTRFARFDISWMPGFKKGDVLQIPWGFGPGGFAAVGAQMAAYSGAKEFTFAEFLGNIVNISLDSFMPLPISRMPVSDNPLAWLVDSVVPSFSRPVIEYAMNTNAFGQSIYNSMQSRKYGDAYGGSDNVAQLYKDISRYIAEVTNGEIDWNPNTLSFFVNNYADAIGRVTHDMYGIQLFLRGNKNFDFKRDTIFFDSFISKYSDIEQRQYSKAVKEVDELRRKLELFKVGNPAKYIDIKTKYPFAEGIISQYDKMKADLDKLNQQAKAIRQQPGLTAKQREEQLEPIKQLQLLYKKSIASQIELGLQMMD